MCSQLPSCIHLFWDSMDCNPQGSSVHGIFQARILEWVAISYSRGSSWPRDQTCISCISCIGRWVLYHCTTWETLWQFTDVLKCTINIFIIVLSKLDNHLCFVPFNFCSYYLLAFRIKTLSTLWNLGYILVFARSLIIISICNFSWMKWPKWVLQNTYSFILLHPPKLPFSQVEWYNYLCVE